MFEPLPQKFDFPAQERAILEFWERERIFERSLELRANAPRFVFYEGPPTANGLPHPGHCLTRAMKDLFPRYQTMIGKLVERKAGWDTHGLPVEREVEKELIASGEMETGGKAAIEKYGVEKFNLKCIQSVFRYTREWEEMTRRLGFWVNLKDAYVTYHQSYVESVWWSLKTLFERGLLYQAHKVVWWWAQGGTALSAGEVGEGYRTVDDPSVFVKFPLVDEPSKSGPDAQAREGEAPANPQRRTSLLVWTTTPWTLISNHFAAVHPQLEYALVHDPTDDEHLYIAAALVEAIAKKVKRELRVVSTCKGAEILGSRYRPPFSEPYYDSNREYPGRQYLGEVPEGPWVGFKLWRETGVVGPSGTLGQLRVPQVEEREGRKFSVLLDRPSVPVGWVVVAADFVTTESGSGIVHEAPAFGEVDFQLWNSLATTRFMGLPFLCAVATDGTFNSDAPDKYRGRWVKDCDKDIIRELRDERKTPWGTPLLYHQEQYRHDYPFCPRAPEDPLIQYARKGWFVRTSQFKDEFLKNNAAVNWLPEHIKEGRFGDFLRNNVDWALSRERYWGTPLPIWVCEKCGKTEAVGSMAELHAKPDAHDRTEAGKSFWEVHNALHGGELPEHLRVHKPYIDAWTYESACCAGSRMKRVPEVIDCWWDAGSMPFAQWGFPHAGDSVARLARRFPADFISEAIDQTRGWFYGLLSISTLLFGPDSPESKIKNSQYPLPFKNCIVLGHILGEDGKKMSKRLKNYPEPRAIFDKYGADAMRWFFLSAQAPWTSVRFADVSDDDVQRFHADAEFREQVRNRRGDAKLKQIERDQPIRDAQSEFLVKLYNVLSFFTIYASIDGFDPRRRDEPGNPMGFRPTEQRGELDRWIITELHRTVRTVRESMDRFENYPAAQRLSDFVDALSNWYVRRSRDRFWSGEKSQAKWDAYHTLYGCLRVLSRLIAPFTPFFAETMHRHLRIPDDPDSVHLCDYPKPEDIRYCDESLATLMDAVRDLVALGRSARAGAKLKVRQPLALVEIVLTDGTQRDALASHAALITEELNVKRVEFTNEADHYVSYKVVPNFKAIGAKFRALVPKLKAALEALPDAAAARRQLVDEGGLPLLIDGQEIRLTPDEVEIRLEAKPGWSAAQGRAGVVVVSIELTPELRDEGLIRELIHHVQAQRKELNLAYEDRIRLHIAGPAEFLAILRRFTDVVKSECLAIEIVESLPPGVEPLKVTVEGHAVELAVAAT